MGELNNMNDKEIKEQLEVAITYFEDGAFLTTIERLNEVITELRNRLNSLKEEEERQKNNELYNKKLNFEIINPSDKCFIEGDFKTCCIATCLLGEGKYGLQQVDGELKMPLMLFGDTTGFFKKNFNATMQETLENINNKELINVLSTVHTETKSSLNDIEGYAKQLIQQLRKVKK
jgi:hypothetical protein